MSKLTLVLVCFLLLLGSEVAAQTTNQNNSTYLNHYQSQSDAYKSEKRSYNTVPGRENDAHNRWLDSQIERNQRDRDRIINQELQNRSNRNNYGKGTGR